MNGLLSAIPGLVAHQVEVPEPVVSFDTERADQLLRDMTTEIGAAYPDEGCIEWLRLNRPEVIVALFSGEQEVDRLYLAEDMPGMAAALDLLRRMYLKAFGIYEARPPVIEVQEAMF